MARVLSERAMTGEKPHCPHCEGIELRRQGRVGFWQRVVLPRFGYFPWECGLCRKIYMLRQRSTDYRQHSTGKSATSLPEARESLTRDPILKEAPRPVIVPAPYREQIRKHG